MPLPPLPRWTGFAPAVLSLAAAAADAPATDPAPTEPKAAAPTPTPTAKPADGKAPQRVEIQGTPDSNTERRRSTASKIIYGREELDRMGDATLGEVLKRLPGVTIGGPPGRGGEIRMRGMGGGYTMIMIDGQRMPPGFSLDQIAPEQIERIEILRAPTAELTARAIAGIINVVMREDFKRKSNEFKFGGSVEDGRRIQHGANWVINGNNETLGYNLGLAAFHQDQGNENTGHLFGTDASGTTNLDQTTHSQSEDKRNGLFANGRLQFRFGPGNSLDLQPFLHVIRNHNRGHSTLDQSIGDIPASYASADYATDSQSEMARVNGTWNRTTGDGGRLMLRFGTLLAHNQSLTNRQEYSADHVATRLKVDDASARDLSAEMNGKYSQLIAERHSVAAGWDIHAGQRNDRRLTTENGLPTLTEFGDNIEARTLRLAAFAQDEWEWSKTFQFYAGVRWEGIQTRSDSLGAPVHNTSSVLAPLAHMVWKLPDAPRDQIRLSLTRSYKSPTTSQLIGRPSVSNLYPDLSKTNQPISPDRAGNPELRPELAWGLDLAAEHYLDAGGLYSANLFVRQIDDLIRTVRALETVSYASAQRWVARPQNIGGALSAGIEMEAKFRAQDLWATELPISVRSNFSLLWSRVDGVQGPNNRLDQQPRYVTNLGFDWPIKGLPLTVGGNLNFTPSFVVQQIDSQVYRQSPKRVIDGYAQWRFSPDASVRLSVNNASARDYETATTTLLADGSAQTADNIARSYTTVQLRVELRF